MIPVSAMTCAMLVALLNSPVVSAESPQPQVQLAVEVRVIGTNGEPVEKSGITLWKLLSSAQPLASDQQKRARFFWREAVSGKVWDPIGGVATSDRWQRSDLGPGTYRATAHLGHDRLTPLGVSDDVTLDGTTQNTILTVRLRPGPKLTFRLFDIGTHQPLSGIKVDLAREDSDAVVPPGWTWTSPASGDEGRVKIDGLPPGTYRLEARRQAWAPEDLVFAAVEMGKKLVVVPERDAEIPVPMVSRPLTQAEIENRWEWVATGTVVDGAGRPLEGAKVDAATGWGTLYGGGSTKTDGAGRFTLRFGEGWQSADPANTQAAIFNVTKDGYVETSRSQPGRHLMARLMPAEKARFGVEATKIILRGTPYRIDFQLSRPATIEVDLRGPSDHSLSVTGLIDSNEGTYSKEAGPNRWELATGQPWRFALPSRHERFSVTSFPITLPTAGRYRAVLQYKPDPEHGVDVLEFVSVVGPDGKDVRGQVVGDDPLSRPAVPEALQQRGRDVLKKMAEANRPWLGGGPREANNYEYRFRLTAAEPQVFKVAGAPTATDVGRGISYISSLHHLASNPSVATFRQVEFGADRITLAYTLKEPIKVWAGNGVSRRWFGYFSMPWREGILTLDSQRLTPLENRSPALTESFTQYTQAGKGQFVPLAIQVDQHGMRFDWTFQLLEPAVWLFASARSDDGKVVASVDQIKVDGVAAKLIAQGDFIARKPR